MKNALFSIILCIVVAVLTYFFIDRVVAWAVYAHNFREKLWFFKYVSYIEVILFAFAFIGFIYFLLTFWVANIQKRDIAILYASISLAITTFIIASCMKFVIHRYWPQTWINDNSSLISNNAYGFISFLGSNSSYSSFPSGHTATICSVLSVFWVMYAKLRVLYVLLILLVAISLLIMNYHFVSDIIVGGFIGFFIGIWTVKIGNFEKASI